MSEPIDESTPRPEPLPDPPMPNATVTPIRPARPTNARTDAPSESTRRRWAHMQRTAQAIEAATASGHADGVRHGYVQGWRWGVATGVVAGALAMAMAWLARTAMVL